MFIEKTPIEDLVILKPKVHLDERGFFLESFRQDIFETLLKGTKFVQDNHALSVEVGVLRGLHFQLPPAEQAKLIWVTRGSVFDVAVDLRKNSKTYGKWFSVELTAENFLRLFIPRGFAHGYITTSPNTEFMYKVDNYYAPNYDSGIAWNDPDLDISWPSLPSHLSEPILSEKDKKQQAFRTFQSPF
ncbi:dTDP-4-dehydrorhamnose 3,5-epimerase [Desulfovibrio litoralis]|uniref:dTDP-4-dehydrorhamnose 3,5-epimerase n=1 Tax=Desulfovibrio litoralis DSM 11393 TaxID=1121455 RepID=A0A1M7T5V2_9BACT|nr:dTDP-4-dehydrorhamnose 3,5-epimerase [Desulfovibrio litoralis]SHN66068.1 dTDP-4-dehydrorhamnose 3,5-epimerase [Desulfovibrio litoralis DSM 11393]